MIQDQKGLGHRQDPSWRRGVHEGAILALRWAETHTPEQMAAWLERVGQWQYDPDAGALAPGRGWG